jgi:hypothetical protein
MGLGESASEDLEQGFQLLQTQLREWVAQDHRQSSYVQSVVFCCAVIVYLLARQLDKSPQDPVELLAAFFVEGRIGAAGDEVTLILSQAAINIDFRRAGLDINPGYLAWLDKTARIVYEGADEH